MSMILVSVRKDWLILAKNMLTSSGKRKIQNPDVITHSLQHTAGAGPNPPGNLLNLPKDFVAVLCGGVVPADGNGYSVIELDSGPK